MELERRGAAEDLHRLASMHAAQCGRALRACERGLAVPLRRAYLRGWAFALQTERREADISRRLEGRLFLLGWSGIVSIEKREREVQRRFVEAEQHAQLVNDARVALMEHRLEEEGVHQRVRHDAQYERALLVWRRGVEFESKRLCLRGWADTLRRIRGRVASCAERNSSCWWDSHRLGLTRATLRLCFMGWMLMLGERRRTVAKEKRRYRVEQVEPRVHDPRHSQLASAWARRQGFSSKLSSIQAWRLFLFDCRRNRMENQFQQEEADASGFLGNVSAPMLNYERDAERHRLQSLRDAGYEKVLLAWRRGALLNLKRAVLTEWLDLLVGVPRMRRGAEEVELSRRATLDSMCDRMLSVGDRACAAFLRCACFRAWTFALPGRNRDLVQKQLSADVKRMEVQARSIQARKDKQMEAACGKAYTGRLKRMCLHVWLRLLPQREVESLQRLLDAAHSTYRALVTHTTVRQAHLLSAWAREHAAILRRTALYGWAALLCKREEELEHDRERRNTRLHACVMIRSQRDWALCVGDRFHMSVLMRLCFRAWVCALQTRKRDALEEQLTAQVRQAGFQVASVCAIRETQLLVAWGKVNADCLKRACLHVWLLLSMRRAVESLRQLLDSERSELQASKQYSAARQAHLLLAWGLELGARLRRACLHGWVNLLGRRARELEHCRELSNIRLHVSLAVSTQREQALHAWARSIAASLKRWFFFGWHGVATAAALELREKQQTIRTVDRAQQAREADSCALARRLDEGRRHLCRLREIDLSLVLRRTCFFMWVCNVASRARAREEEKRYRSALVELSTRASLASMRDRMVRAGDRGCAELLRRAYFRAWAGVLQAQRRHALEEQLAAEVTKAGLEVCSIRTAKDKQLLAALNKVNADHVKQACLQAWLRVPAPRGMKRLGQLLLSEQCGRQTLETRASARQAHLLSAWTREHAALMRRFCLYRWAELLWSWRHKRENDCKVSNLFCHARPTILIRCEKIAYSVHRGFEVLLKRTCLRAWAWAQQERMSNLKHGLKVPNITHLFVAWEKARDRCLQRTCLHGWLHLMAQHEVESLRRLYHNQRSESESSTQRAAVRQAHLLLAWGLERAVLLRCVCLHGWVDLLRRQSSELEYDRELTKLRLRSDVASSTQLEQALRAWAQSHCAFSKRLYFSTWLIALTMARQVFSEKALACKAEEGWQRHCRLRAGELSLAQQRASFLQWVCMLSSTARVREEEGRCRSAVERHYGLSTTTARCDWLLRAYERRSSVCWKHACIKGWAILVDAERRDVEYADMLAKAEQTVLCGRRAHATMCSRVFSTWGLQTTDTLRRVTFLVWSCMLRRPRLQEWQHHARVRASHTLWCERPLLACEKVFGRALKKVCLDALCEDARAAMARRHAADFVSGVRRCAWAPRAFKRGTPASMKHVCFGGWASALRARASSSLLLEIEENEIEAALCSGPAMQETSLAELVAHGRRSTSALRRLQCVVASAAEESAVAVQTRAVALSAAEAALETLALPRDSPAWVEARQAHGELKHLERTARHLCGRVVSTIHMVESTHGALLETIESLVEAGPRVFFPQPAGIAGGSSPQAAVSSTEKVQQQALHRSNISPCGRSIQAEFQTPGEGVAVMTATFQLAGQLPPTFVASPQRHCHRAAMGKGPLFGSPRPGALEQIATDLRNFVEERRRQTSRARSLPAPGTPSPGRTPGPCRIVIGNVSPLPDLA